MPGLVLALRQKRYEIVLLAVLPVIGALIAGCFENRLLLGIPFWVILMAFTFDRVLKLELRPSFKIPVLGVSAVILIAGLAPALQYINNKTKDPFSIRYYAQQEVAVSRFLKEIVAGKRPADPLAWNTTSSTALKIFPTLLMKHSSARETLIRLSTYSYMIMMIRKFSRFVPTSRFLGFWTSSKFGALTRGPL